MANEVEFIACWSRYSSQLFDVRYEHCCQSVARCIANFFLIWKLILKCNFVFLILFHICVLSISSEFCLSARMNIFVLEDKFRVEFVLLWAALSLTSSVGNIKDILRTNYIVRPNGHPTENIRNSWSLNFWLLNAWLADVDSTGNPVDAASGLS